MNQSPSPAPDSSIRIAPSVLAADFARLGEELRDVQEAGADRIHLDIMDGHFVPNLTFGPPVIARLAPHAKVPMDAHLMVSRADTLIEGFAAAGAAQITLHPESEPHLHRSLLRVREHGAVAGIALNPATPVAAVEPVLDLIGSVLVMSVNPGFGGQEFLPGACARIRALRKMLDATGRAIDLTVDGGINAETAPQAAAAGANVLVAGSAIFTGGGGAKAYAERIDAIRRAVA